MASVRCWFLVLLMLPMVPETRGDAPPRLHRLETYSFDELPADTLVAGEVSSSLKPGGEPVIVWVQFRDKGFRDEEGFRQRSARERQSLPERTLRRRGKVLSGDFLIRVGDLPLEERYVHAVVAQGARLRARSRWFNAVSVEANPETVGRIARLPFVYRIEPVVRESRSIAPAPGEPVPSPVDKGTSVGSFDYGPSVTQIAQIYVDLLHARGLSGKGVIVGVLDAGFAPFSTEALDHAVILGERDFVDRDSTTFDTPEHGTSVLSVLGGFAPGNLIGPAFGASFFLARTEIVEDGIEIRLEEDLWVEGLEWLEREGADVVNSSLGYSDWYQPEDFDGMTAVTTVAADAAVERGVFIANSAGNEGIGGLTAPADGFNVCAAGGVLSSGASWTGSSRGPTADGRIKPDVSAMSVAVRKANSLLQASGQQIFNTDYDMREGPLDLTASKYIAAGRATNSFRLALTLKDDATDEVAWMGKTVGDFSGLAVSLVRDGATQELWANDFSDPRVLTDPFPDGFGYQGDVLRFQDGGIETTAENRFDIALLLDLTPLLPAGGLVEGDWVFVRTTANLTRSQPGFIPLTGIQISYLDDVARRDYANGLGTSFASPLVAGAAALLLEARPGWTPLQVLGALRSTASQADVPDNEVGYGIVNAYRALFNSDVPPSADLDGDGFVNADDLYLFHQDWQTIRTANETPLGSAIRSDMNLDSQIDGDDLYLISSQWEEDSP